MTKKIKIHKNTILYGPPGTGKTYNTIAYAVAIIDGKEISQDKKTGAITVKDYTDRESLQKRFNELKETNLVEFCTFHQSYSYEEFIEGIKPKVEIDNTTNEKSIIYEVTDGIFKKFCQNAYLAKNTNPTQQQSCIPNINNNPTIWKIVLQNPFENDIRSDCMSNHHIRIGYDNNYKDYNEVLQATTMKTAEGSRLNAFINDLKKGDIVVSYRSGYKFDNIGVVTGDCKLDPNYKTYNLVRPVKWLLSDTTLRGINLIASTCQPRGTINRMPNANLESIKQNIDKTTEQILTTIKNKVFIIDEINRGNISKIFGELITLIEDTKRINISNPNQGMRLRLPYSHDEDDIGFGVPDNIYILGTMNTADRSIALIDTALRRRFKFIEMAPSFNLLNSVIINGINICNMMERINERIEILYDRDHKIGHSFFMKLNNNSTIGDLAEIFEYDIIPLLQEYFYNDWEKIAAILGDDFERKDKTYNFINRIEIKDDIVRKYDMDKIYTYNLNKDAFEKAITYVKIYEPSTLNNTTLESAYDGE